MSSYEGRTTEDLLGELSDYREPYALLAEVLRRLFKEIDNTQDMIADCARE